MACRGSPLWRSLLGAKRTLLVAAQMSAFDPKRTWIFRPDTMLVRLGVNEAAGIPDPYVHGSGHLAACGGRTAG